MIVGIVGNSEMSDAAIDEMYFTDGFCDVQPQTSSSGELLKISVICKISSLMS